jgi:hypothetical protein
MAAQYISTRLEADRNRPALQHVVYFDQNYPSSNYYDAQHGEWNLRVKDGKQVWVATPPTDRLTSVSFVTQDITSFHRALIKLAVGLKSAFLIPEKDFFKKPSMFAGSIATYRAVLVGPGETRFQSAGPNYEAVGIPLGTALMFPGEHEETGRVVCWNQGSTTEYGITIWGRIHAVQFESGFERHPEIPA